MMPSLGGGAPTDTSALDEQLGDAHGMVLGASVYESQTNRA